MSKLQLSLGCATDDNAALKRRSDDQQKPLKQVQLQLMDRSLMASTERDHEREKEPEKDGQLAALTTSLAAETARADALQEIFSLAPLRIIVTFLFLYF